MVAKKRKRPSKAVINKAKIDWVDQYFETKKFDLESYLSRLIRDHERTLYQEAKREYQNLEREFFQYKNMHQALVNQLTGLLNEPQLEAARLANCLPEQYAIEWFKVCKERSEGDRYNIAMTVPKMESF